MLINSTTELRNYLPASVALDFNDIRPKIKLVEREIIKRIFSTALYDAMNASGATGNLLELKEILSEAVAHLALLHYIGFGQTQISSAGIRIATNDNMKTAFEWQIDEIKDECSRQGWSAVESALEFLDKTTDEGILLIWVATETYSTAQKNLIPNLRDFEKFVNLNHSRVLFNKLAPIMNDQQEEIILPAIGYPLFERILDDDTTIGLQAKKLAAKALAFQTMATGFIDTMLILSDNGPLVINGMASAMPKAKQTATTDLIQIIAENYKTRAAGALRELLEFCQANVNVLTEYQESDNYISDEEQSNHIPRNDPDWGIAFF